MAFVIMLLVFLVVGMIIKTALSVLGAGGFVVILVISVIAFLAYLGSEG